MKNSKKYEKSKNMGQGGRLEKPQLHWLLPLKTVQFQTLT